MKSTQRQTESTAVLDQVESLLQAREVAAGYDEATQTGTIYVTSSVTNADTSVVEVLSCRVAFAAFKSLRILATLPDVLLWRLFGPILCGWARNPPSASHSAAIRDEMAAATAAFEAQHPQDKRDLMIRTRLFLARVKMISLARGSPNASGITTLTATTGEEEQREELDLNSIAVFHPRLLAPELLVLSPSLTSIENVLNSLHLGEEQDVHKWGVHDLNMFQALTHGSVEAVASEMYCRTHRTPSRIRSALDTDEDEPVRKFGEFVVENIFGASFELKFASVKSDYSQEDLVPSLIGALPGEPRTRTLTERTAKRLALAFLESNADALLGTPAFTSSSSFATLSFLHEPADVEAQIQNVTATIQTPERRRSSSPVVTRQLQPRSHAYAVDPSARVFTSAGRGRGEVFRPRHRQPDVLRAPAEQPTAQLASLSLRQDPSPTASSA